VFVPDTAFHRGPDPGLAPLGLGRLRALRLHAILAVRQAVVAVEFVSEGWRAAPSEGSLSPSSTKRRRRGGSSLRLLVGSR
jgi:hypothetical protein